MKTPNFDQYLEEQLQELAMAARLEHAGETPSIVMRAFYDNVYHDP